jgi:Xaa-Pro aminopeptidase
VLKQGDALFADLCGVAHRYHANTSRTYWLGEPPAEVVDNYAKNAGSFAVISEHGRAGTPFGEVCDALREYYDGVGLDPRGFGYDLGISFPPDWVGPFVWSFGRGNDGDTFSTIGLGDNPDDWVFRDGMVTNYESLMGESLMQSFVIEPEGARLLSNLPIEISVV